MFRGESSSISSWMDFRWRYFCTCIIEDRNINIDIVKTSLYKRQEEIGYTLFFFQMDLFIILAPPKSAGIFFFVLSFLPTLNHPAFFKIRFLGCVSLFPSTLDNDATCVLF